jgi:hypothetical protein
MYLVEAIAIIALLSCPQSAEEDDIHVHMGHPKVVFSVLVVWYCEHYGDAGPLFVNISIRSTNCKSYVTNQETKCELKDGVVNGLRKNQ